MPTVAGVEIKSRTDKRMALVALGFMAMFAAYGLYSSSFPIYWHAYATFIKPFNDPSFRTHGDDPFSALIRIDPPTGEQGQPPLASIHSSTEKQNKLGEPAQASMPSIQEPEKPKEPRVLYYDDLALTRELVMKHVQDGYIMVTWANEHYLDFAVSWVASVKRQGITGYIVGAMDDDMLKQLFDREVNCWRMNTGISKRDLGWGSSLFHQMGRSKISLILAFMQLVPEITVVISDIDTAWLRNPFPFFSRYPEADILTSSDQLRPTVQTEDLERWPEAGAAFNIGIMMFRPGSKEFVVEWIKTLEKPSVWDQNAFNDISRRGSGRSDAKGVFPAFGGKLKMGVLPVTLFASGQVFYVQRKHEEFGLKPYVAHATFQYSGTPGKRHRMREALLWEFKAITPLLSYAVCMSLTENSQYSGTPGKRHRMREALLWEDEPSYFDHPKGFISLKVDIPPELLANATGKNLKHALTITQTDSHFNLVNYQLLHIRAGVALAQLTGRVLIMPPIWCELDKYWAVLEYGSIPGSKFKRPFICPMDHIFEIENGWFPERPYGNSEEQMGPRVEWREYSFLKNPRLSKSVSDSRLTVDVCPQSDKQGCSDGSSPAPIQDASIRVSPGLDSDRISKALASASQYKILEFKNVDSLWPQYSQSGGWFTDPVAHRRFVKRISFMTSVACCLQFRPGWMWYDMQWDVPHTDRFNRHYDKWHIKMGDNGDIRPPRVRRQLLGGHASEEALLDQNVQQERGLRLRLQGRSPL